MNIDLDIWTSIRQLRSDVEPILKADIPAARLTYSQRILNPFPTASSGGFAGDFPQSGAIAIISFNVSVFVQTANDGSNFWTIELINTAASTLASITTAAVSVSTWTRLSDTTITQPSSSNVALTIKATRTGTAGNIFIVPEIVIA